MGTYDAQQVCLTGHQITNSYYSKKDERRDRCEKCGSTTIHKCPKCGEDIRGKEYGIGGSDKEVISVPEFCVKCGTPFPWTAVRGSVGEKQQINFREPHAIVRSICRGFHSVARQLETRHSDRPTITIDDEYDVQDLLHALLRLFFNDIRKEEWTPSYAGGSARMDFLLKRESMVIETKMTRGGLGDKEIGEQLIVDIARYRTHPDCKRLICFVYDPNELVRNPAGLEGDLSQAHEKLDVEVLIFPKK
jgi:hypothetical protein